jgi:hypothetical protein
MKKANQTPPLSAQFLKRKTLRQRWDCSLQTLVRREKAGLLPFLKIGSSVLYRLSDVELIEAAAEVKS